MLAAQKQKDNIKNASPTRMVENTCQPLRLPLRFLYHRINQREVSPRPSHPRNIVIIPPLTAITPMLTANMKSTKLNFLSSF